jgi:hypothetical protein
MKEAEATRLLAKLKQEGEVVCESPKVRKLMHTQLEAEGVEYSVEQIGTTGGRKPLNPWIAGPRNGIGYSPRSHFSVARGEPAG